MFFSVFICIEVHKNTFYQGKRRSMMKESILLNSPDTHFREKEMLDARVSQSEVAGIYDALSPMYDLWGKFTESRARDRAIELADIKDGQKILEVAVGTGIAFYEIAKRNPNGINLGIDLSEGMLAKARKRLQRLKGINYELKTGSALRLEEKDASFDLLMNNYMFDLLSFEDMDVVLQEFKRVLQVGGKLVLVNMTLGEKFGADIYNRLYRISPRLMGGCRGIQLSEKLEVHGFKVTLREYYQQLLFPSEVIMAEK
jgi:ubiquinone/menaquinone biosynthesis C-methylase UbiE